MMSLLLYIANFIRNRSIKHNIVNKVKQLQDFGQTTWKFISSIYEVEWDVLETNKNNRTFRQNISSKFTSKSNIIKPVKKSEQSKKKQLEAIKLLSPILVRLPKEVLEKLRFF